MPYCANCGNNIEERAKFCPKCGQRVTRDSAPRELPNQQTKIQSNVGNICSNCGGQLSSIEQYQQWYCHSCQQYQQPPQPQHYYRSGSEEKVLKIISVEDKYGVNYDLYFTSFRVIAARLGGTVGWVLALGAVGGTIASAHQKKKKREQLELVSLQEILKVDKKNFEIPYANIFKIDMVRTKRRTIKMLISTYNAKHEFHPSAFKDFETYVSLVTSVLPGRIFIYDEAKIVEERIKKDREKSRRQLEEARADLKKVGKEFSDLSEQLSDSQARIKRIKETGDVMEYIRALDDQNHYLRIGAAEELVKLKEKRAVEPLIQTLEDDDWGVRRMAAIALGKIGDARAEGPLAQLLNDESMLVRRAAKGALKRIRKQRGA
ncbi:MAG: HEAT repeat domain-containing protein [Thermoplasmata archaeon]|nr:MAG: HEAT repeat domain-containing protein [Thermoplasmata archaeon]